MAGINLLICLFGWRHLGPTRMRRQTAALMLLLNALIPWVVSGWLVPAEGSVLSKVVWYTLAQIVWILSVDVAPDWVGRRRQRHYEERVLGDKKADQ